MDIISLLVCLEQSVDRTTIKRLSCIIVSMLTMTGRVTMLGIARWSEKGGSYRSVQRLFAKTLPWASMSWLYVRHHLLRAGDEYVLAGDETVVTKAGKQNFGLDRFFASIYGKAVPGLAFFALSLVSVRERRSYPLMVEQHLRTAEEKQAARSKQKKQKRATSGTGAKKASTGRPGRPKGNKNKDKSQIQWNSELHLIQTMLQKLMALLGNACSVAYLVMDGHFGNNNALQMVRQATSLHLISKLRHDAALYFVYAGAQKHFGPRRCYYSLRFQLEFNFRDAKQFWGLEDFMNVKQTPVANAVNLSLFMVNLSHYLVQQMRLDDPHASLLDLKALFRGRRYALDTLNLLPEAPTSFISEQIVRIVTSLGRIHPRSPALSNP